MIGNASPSRKGVKKNWLFVQASNEKPIHNNFVYYPRWICCSENSRVIHAVWAKILKSLYRNIHIRKLNSFFIIFLDLYQRKPFGKWILYYLKTQFIFYLFRLISTHIIGKWIFHYLKIKFTLTLFRFTFTQVIQ